jgi:hypothetical protein
MKLFRKIDTTTGNFVEDVLFESHPFLMETVQEEITLEDGTTEIALTEQPLLDAEGNPQLDPQYVEEAPPQGLYLPRYLNGVWVEGGVAPESVPIEPSEEERLEAVEEAITALMGV